MVDYKSKYFSYVYLNYKKTYFLKLTSDVFSRTRTSWRSCEVKLRRSARGWVAIGCPLPGPPWTSWKWSQQPCWTGMSPSRTAREEVWNCGVDSRHVLTHHCVFSLTRPALLTSQANLAASTEGHKSPGGTLSVSAPSTTSFATFQPSNLPRSRSARSLNRSECCTLLCPRRTLAFRCKIRGHIALLLISVPLCYWFSDFHFSLHV